MGAWGYGLFQSDNHLDVLDEISNDVTNLANEGQLVKEDYISLYYPPNRERVADKLSHGIFHRLLVEYQQKDWSHGVIFLGAATMAIGGHISKDDMKAIRLFLVLTTMYHQAKAQMQKGLNEYKNDGEPYDFGSLGLPDTMMSNLGGGGGGGMNVLEDGSKMAKPKP